MSSRIPPFGAGFCENLREQYVTLRKPPRSSLPSDRPENSEGARLLMGWTGIVVLGAAVGLAGWWLHPRRNRSARSRRGMQMAIAIAAGVAGAAVAKMAGSVTGIFLDGDTLEWPVCTAAALLAVAVTAGLASRR
ncbi:hypothetical protein PXJ20_00370 [Paraburkholderia sp. A1RI_3L]|uniref:hypothetical protein n=1 Tax=Paraburkholderia TaxID=1822464 RepID=UPI003B7F895A